MFKNNKWLISDGTGNKQSMNGTWLSLSDYRAKRDFSDPVDIKNQDQLKISDSQLTFEFIGFSNDRLSESQDDSKLDIKNKKKKMLSKSK